MVQSSHSVRKLHLSRIVLAGVVVLVLAWWAQASDLFSGFANKDSTSPSSAESAALADGRQVGEDQNFAASDFDNRVNSDSSTQSLDAVGEAESPLPEPYSPGNVEVRGAAKPVMLSDGSSLEDQLQTQRSAELRELYPVESPPSGTLSTPPAPPRAASPHQ